MYGPTRYPGRGYVTLFPVLSVLFFFELVVDLLGRVVAYSVGYFACCGSQFLRLTRYFAYHFWASTGQSHIYGIRRGSSNRTLGIPSKLLGSDLQYLEKAMASTACGVRAIMGGHPCKV
eukprot:SAG11_NODE_3432_length_2450_cov_2.080391_3_plen_119_part_00